MRNCKEFGGGDSSGRRFGKRWLELGAHLYNAGAWARELLIYPKINGEFKKGQDVIDEFRDNKYREWIFPASNIPELAIGRKEVGLFVNPQNIEIKDKRVIILAESESVIILTPFIQKYGGATAFAGKVDEETRIPLNTNKEEWENLKDDQIRYLYRNKGAGVRPIERSASGYPFGGRLIDAQGDLRECIEPREAGTGWVSRGNTVKQSVIDILSKIPNWPIELQNDADIAQESLSSIEGAIRKKPFESIQRLIRTAKKLEIKRRC